MTVAPTPKFTAAVDLIGRTGAIDFQVRWDDDQEPVVWLAVARYPEDRWDAAAGRNPEQATLRLCEVLVDGGTCIHCHKPTGFDEDHDDAFNVAVLPSVCWYMWDPELATFRRGCE